MKTLSKVKFLVVLGIITVLFSCSKKDTAPTAIDINILQNGGDAEATFSGTGNSGYKTVTWNNSLKNTNWDMSLSNATSGTFQLQVWDAQHVLVLDKTLTVGAGANSLSGTTTTGAAGGNWTIKITVSNFKGTGSFSLTPA